MRESALKDVILVIFGTLAAVVLYTLAGAAGPSVLVVLNAFSVIVVYSSLRKGEVFGALTGTACGLVQDAFSLGIFGLGGLTKTLLGFFTGYVARRIDISQAPRAGAFLVVASALELGIWTLLSAVVHQGGVNLHGGLILLQPPVTALMVILLTSAERRYRAWRKEA